MKKFPEVSQLNLPAIDQEILKFWESEKIFQKSIDSRKGATAFVFYEGPPSANGMPGIHHVMSRTVKDLFCRYQTLKGNRVERKGGWDTHGLPIELSVEKELNITKEDIGNSISIEEYNRKCRETVMRYKSKWDELTRKMGYWVDLEHPYITFENDYIESVWSLLKLLYEKELLYKGYTIQPYSPAAGTGLSSHELNQPGTYREVKDISVAAQFGVIRDERSEFLFEKTGGAPLSFVAWTTTPWTLPSNTALAVGENMDYSLVQTVHPYTHQTVFLVLASDCVDRWIKEGEGQTVLRFPGKTLEFIRYEQLLPFTQPENGPAFQVLLGDFVTTEEGTGIVHIAPSFGADDMRVARKYGFGSLTLVDKQGRFTEEMGEFAGRYVKDYTDAGENYQNPDLDIALRLKEAGKAFQVQKFVHNYPHCWRTDKPILYYPLDSWFIRTTAMKDRMVELNRQINWKPASTGEKRFANWLENLQDWNLSRSRFWGIPLPIWRTLDQQEELCIGSINELKIKIREANEALDLQQSTPDDLHRPYIDKIVLVSPSGKPMYREADLIDVWFDSGSMPYAQWHYPFENVDKFKENFPADFIAEGVDQTRGWFFTLHAIAVMCFDSVAYKNVVSNGLVQDKFGRKMSKRLGNTVEPFQTIDTYGADATRWYMISNSQPWDNLKFDLEGVTEVTRKLFNTLFNTYSFFALYANLEDKLDLKHQVEFQSRPEIDRWILSELHSLILEVDTAFADYEPTQAARKIEGFVQDQLSNWYVRLSRRRFWKGEMSQDKLSAYQTLFECLTTVARLMSPIAPFFAEWMYRNLLVDPIAGTPSVHMEHFPESRTPWIQKELEERMHMAQEICSTVLSLRKRERIRVRQPLQKILIPCSDERMISQIKLVENLILSEVNVKELAFVDEAEGFVKRSAKANFKTLGKILGKHMKAAAELISSFENKQILQLEQEGAFTITIDGETFQLQQDDVIIQAEDIPGWAVASNPFVTVALDIQISDTLLKEGTARELINRIQNMRKNSDLNVTDRIRVTVEAKDHLVEALQEFEEYVRREVLADQILLSQESLESQVEFFDDEMIGLRIEKA